MLYLYRRGHSALRRVMHLTPYDPRTGKPTMQPLCMTGGPYDTTCNLPLGLRICKRCAKAAIDSAARSFGQG